MDALINAVFAGHDANSLAAVLKAAKIAFGRLNDVAGLASHPQLRTTAVGVPGGRSVDIIAPPARFGGAPDNLGPVPALGEHSKLIRTEFAE